jgi:hypothetical protein
MSIVTSAPFDCRKGLNRDIIESNRTGDLTGLQIGRAINLTHFLFVDDVLLYDDGTRRDVIKLKEIQYLYCLATGMTNMQKSSIC